MSHFNLEPSEHGAPLRRSGQEKKIRAKHSRGDCFQRKDQEPIDSDLRIIIYRPAKSPMWYIQYNEPGLGQRKKSLRTSNKKEAQRRARQIVRQLEHGESPYGERKAPEIKTLVEDFLAEKKRIGRRSSTVMTYRQQLAPFCAYMLEKGIRRADQVRRQHIVDYGEWLPERAALTPEKNGGRTRMNKQTTIYEKIKLIKSVFKWASGQGIIATNHLAAFRLPAKGKSDNYCFTANEVEAICRHAEPFFGTVFRFLALTGLREGELMWLTKKDVDLKRRIIEIRSKEVSGKHWRPKTDEREVPLCLEALAIAKEALTVRPDSPWLFPSPPAANVKGDRLRAARLCLKLRRAKKAAGVQRGTVHSFRHFFVSSLANRNVPAFQVMKMVGHRNLEIVLNYYHARSDELVAALDAANFGAICENDSEK